ncbi:MAG TPA: tetratricopeptide repeat protein [Bacteroidia bacterium]|jgi:antitoxin component YwqK of YwqJK toxin-antitoxin module/Tfp pilus assembly protein PilF|nr:tetratricopeptide repeat protein [Bacteroidia bacterium]
MKKINFFYITIIVLALSFEAKSQTLTPPINSGDIMEEAFKLSKEKNYNEAITEFLKIDENDTNYMVASIELANAYLSARRDSEAVVLADKFLAEKNKYEENFYIVKGSALEDTGKFETAMKAYNEGLVKYPRSYLIYFNIGVSYLRKKDYPNAEKYLQKAVTVNPFHASSHFRLGLAAFQEGKLAPALLSFMFFLQLENTTQRGSDLVIFMEKILKKEVEPEGPIVAAGETDDFSDLEAIIKSKVALNGKYKSKIDLQYDFVKQLQLFLEKLSYNSGDKGFWMQTYVPFFTAVQKQNYFEDFMYYALKPLGNETINKWIDKHASSQKKYVDWVSNILDNSLFTYEENMNGNKQKVRHFYYGNYKPEAAGNVTNGKATGYWKYFHKTGFVKSEGPFDDKGQRDGLWKYYYDGGELKEEATFKHDKLYGPYTKYDRNGSKSLVANYVDDLYDGTVETYYKTNIKKGSYTFKKGKKEGKEITYYSNGAKKYELNYVNDMGEGAFTQYHPNGKVLETATFSKNKRNGPYVHYYEDGAKKSEGTIKEDNNSGTYKAWHKNGNLQEEGQYNDKGLNSGIWKKYTADGKLNEEILYSEKGKAISNKFYSHKGQIENELFYNKSEELSESKSYDGTGKVMNDQKKKGKNFPVTFYRINGNKISEGTYTEDKQDGEWKYYNVDGYVSEDENYKEGKLHGKYQSFHNNNKVKVECEYKNGLIEGIYKTYYINGTLERQGYYVNNAEQGYWYYYNENGVLSNIRYYLNGSQTGKQQIFATNGKKIRDEYITDDFFTKIVCYDSTGKVTNTNLFPLGTGDYLFSHANGKPYFKGALKGGLSEGTYTWYYNNGSIETQGTYQNDKREGVFVYNYENGQKEREEHYFNGDLHGTYTSNYENGTLHEEFNYKYGNEDGVQKTYHENKTLYRIAPYIHGKAQGPLKYMSEDGQLIISKYYDNDIMVSYSFINKAGKYDSIPIKNESGKVLAYFANGQKSIEYEMQNGYTHGKKTEYFTNGKIKKDENYYYGQENGALKAYYANGNLKSETNYVIGEKHGPSKQYYENGKVKQEGYYTNGHKFGVWKYYDNAGKLTKSVKYYDNQPL